MFANNKRGISELIAYVLLITLAIAMAAAAWVFLKPYAEKPLPEEECPESINVILANYSCHDGKIDLELENRGLFKITGIKLRVINDSSGFEHDFLWFLPVCGGVENCQACTGRSDCLGVDENSKKISASDLPYDKIDTLVIYPVKFINNNVYVCTNAVMKIPVHCR